MRQLILSTDMSFHYQNIEKLKLRVQEKSMNPNPNPNPQISIFLIGFDPKGEDKDFCLE